MLSITGPDRQPALSRRISQSQARRRVMADGAGVVTAPPRVHINFVDLQYRLDLLIPINGFIGNQ